MWERKQARGPNRVEAALHDYMPRRRIPKRYMPRVSERGDLRAVSAIWGYPAYQVRGVQSKSHGSEGRAIKESSTACECSAAQRTGSPRNKSAELET